MLRKGLERVSEKENLKYNFNGKKIVAFEGFQVVFEDGTKEDYHKESHERFIDLEKII